MVRCYIDQLEFTVDVTVIYQLEFTVDVTVIDQ